ncbi:hypothetical protein CPB84DRAFT_1746147 [Gymnopilus junonius]|uniref:F-box protein n=1 Tax=Gymnopilus junonius TaxID=109634 RepID=A0A9P5NS44_GYMJU|nr:hypothetical protein CPB84DRAFT_1746147 [Gymnopilus junonius]
MSSLYLKHTFETVTLPFDILLAVIDEVAFSNDISTLRSCSLLHRDFLPYCRKYLFGTFDMLKASPNTERYFLKFYVFLTKNQHLAYYVRVVHILFLKDSLVDLKKWLQTWGPSMARLLRLLTHVEFLGLYSGHTFRGLWCHIAPEVQSALMQIAALTCCKQLNFLNFDGIPRSLLNNCRSLKSLNMTSSSLESLDPQNELNKKTITIPKANWIHLEDAMFSNSENIFQYFYPYTSTSPLFLDFSSLKRLSVTLSPDISEALWKLIYSALETLESLSINQTYKEEITTMAITYYPFNNGCLTKVGGSYPTLSPLSHLRRFSFSIMPHVLPGHSHLEHFSELCMLLRTCPLSIREINIKIDLFLLTISADEVEDIFFPGDDVDNPRPPFLQELDSTFSDWSLFPSLTDVKVDILLADDYAQTSDSDSEYIQSEPELMSFSEIEKSVRNMMKLTRRSLRGKGHFLASARIGNRIH